jgi:hypothetical protein
MKPKILVIEPYCPIPSDSGGKTRISHTLRFLSHQFSLDLLVFYHNRTEVAVNKTFFEKLNIHSTLFPASKRGLLSFFTTGIPYWFAPWYSKKLVRHLKKTDFTNYTSVIIEQTQLLYLVDHIPKTTRTVFSAHDISTISFWRRLRDVGFFKRILHFPRFIEVFFYELYYLKKFSHVVAVTTQDAYYLRLLFRLRSVSVIENGIEKIDFIPPIQKQNTIRLGYLGSPKHTPNKKSIEFITQQIYPLLQSKNFVVNLGGSDSTVGSINGINTLGFVPSTKKYFEQIDILVAPIFAGSGSRVKILESLSFGRSVVTTKVGAEGLNIHSPLLTIIPPIDQQSPKIWAKVIKHQPTVFDPKTYTNLATSLTKHLWSTQLEKLTAILK